MSLLYVRRGSTVRSISSCVTIFQEVGLYLYTVPLYDSTAIATAAMEMLGGKEALAQCRTDQIMADAAYVILTRDSRARTGEFLIDEDVLREVGVTEFEQYSCVPGVLSIIKKK